MEDFISSLEMERYMELNLQESNELSAYLKVTGFSNFELSEREREHPTLKYFEI